MSKLFTLLFYSINKKTPIDIHIYGTGEVLYFANKELFTFEDVADFMIPKFKSFVSISLTEHISYYIGQDYINAALKEAVFSKDELLIIDIIKKEKPKSLTIEFTPKNTIDIIKIKKNKNVDLQQRVSEIFLNNAYEQVTITTEKGKIVNCIKEIKIKPNSKNTG